MSLDRRLNGQCDSQKWVPKHSFSPSKQSANFLMSSLAKLYILTTQNICMDGWVLGWQVSKTYILTEDWLVTLTASSEWQNTHFHLHIMLYTMLMQRRRDSLHQTIAYIEFSVQINSRLPFDPPLFGIRTELSSEIHVFQLSCYLAGQPSSAGFHYLRAVM